MSTQPSVRELRSMLREVELAVARVRRGVSAPEILALYGLLDQIAAAFPQVQQAGAHVEPELVRFETIGAILRDKARSVVQGLASGGGLAAYRQQAKPPESHWWWYLDQQVAHEQAQRRTRLVRGALVGTAVVAALVTLYVLVLRPDEATRLRYDHQFEAESQVQQGNYAQALESYQKALELAPEDAELYLVIGVLYEALGQPDRAERQYAEAERRFDTYAAFLTARSQQFARLGRYERAMEEAQTATELDERYALAHCALGSAYQGLGENNDAIAAFWVCADLASEQGQDELYVHAKTILATLMQQPS